MLDDLALIRFPELVVGIAGPIGVDIETICTATEDALGTVDYESLIIKLTDEIDDLPSTIKKPKGRNFHGLMKLRWITQANSVDRAMMQPSS